MAALEYYPRLLLVKNNPGEWQEYQVVTLHCHAAPNNYGSIFIQTGFMVDDGIVVALPQRTMEELGRFFWADIPTGPQLNFTYILGDNAIIPTGVVYKGELYPLS